MNTINPELQPNSSQGILNGIRRVSPYSAARPEDIPQLKDMSGNAITFRIEVPNDKDVSNRFPGIEPAYIRKGIINRASQISKQIKDINNINEEKTFTLVDYAGVIIHFQPSSQETENRTNGDKFELNNK